MKRRTFFWFILPSLAAMVLFIALPIASVLAQSLFVEPEQVVVSTQNCGPFGCTQSSTVDAEATAKVRTEHPLGRFNGLGTYLDRAHLANAGVARAYLRVSRDGGQGFQRIMGTHFARSRAVISRGGGQ